MAYKALYRRFRPLLFEDVIGQEHITNTIKNQVQNNMVAHAYLFSGGRGSGKTTTAKILARAVNCLHPVNGEPCNECEICKAAIDGLLTDISEIDAASNNGVDNIRDIREEVEYVPTNSKYRVYIIDEVHMLSTGAFNALLKTLEEPPKHVIFILATTDPQKIPITILSRCQRFDFRHISVNDIVKRLQFICSEINIEAEENALKLIAKMADGAMRDAISLLDRCIADGETLITEEKIRILVGIPEFEQLFNMVKLISDRNIEGLLNHIDIIINSGKDLEVYLNELIKFVRDIAIFNASGEHSLMDSEEIEKIKSLVVTQDKLLDLIIEFSDILSSIKWSNNKDVIFETGMLKIVMKNFSNEIPKEKIQVENISSNVISNVQNSQDFGEIKAKVLTNLKENHKMIMHTILSNASFKEMPDDLIHIIFSKNIDDVNKQYMQKDESKTLIKEVIRSVLGKEMKIKYVF